MSVEENVFKDRKGRYEEINRFRNGFITQHLTSVDMKDVARAGSHIVDFVEDYICDKSRF